VYLSSYDSYAHIRPYWKICTLMKSSNDVDDIKAIFASIPDDLELGKPPISEIEMETFAQMLAPICKLMKGAKNSFMYWKI